MNKVENSSARVLQVQAAHQSWEKATTVPEGVTVVDKSEFDDDGKWYAWEEWVLHSLGEPIYLRTLPWEGMVLDFGGRTWRVTLREPNGWKEDKFPDEREAFLVFTPTTDAATESNCSPPEPDCRLYGAQVYGQPHFRQGDCFPTHEGKAAYLLWSQETPEGDCGQENVFLALDADGLPCRVWREWSCC